MRPIPFLKCLGKALVRQVGNAVGLGWAGEIAVEVGEDVWEEWQREKDEAQRRAELESLIRMAADEFHQQVEAVVREVAAGQPPEVRRRVSAWLEQVPE